MQKTIISYRVYNTIVVLVTAAPIKYERFHFKFVLRFYQVGAHIFKVRRKIVLVCFEFLLD